MRRCAINRRLICLMHRYAPSKIKMFSRNLNQIQARDICLRIFSPLPKLSREDLILTCVEELLTALDYRYRPTSNVHIILKISYRMLTYIVPENAFFLRNFINFFSSSSLDCTVCRIASQILVQDEINSHFPLFYFFPCKKRKKNVV